jgi:signal transduction histidine kinase
MFSRSLNFRFTALFSGFFAAGSALLFLFTYLFLAGSLHRDDAAAIRSKLLEFWAVYQTGKIELVRRELNLERLVTEERLFMLRIAGRRNNTLFLYLPVHWREYDPGRLERLSSIREGEVVSLPSREGPGALEVASVQLHDGNILQIGMTDARRRGALRRFRRIFLLVFLPLGAMSVLGGFLFSSRSLAPVRQLIRATRDITATGQMNARIPPRGSGDELDELVSLFNQMLAKIDSLIQAMRESLDNVAHDLRTPLTRLRGSVELALQQTEKSPSGREVLAVCVEESGRILTMLSTLMDISEAEHGVMRLEKRPVDLRELVADLVELYGYSAEDKGVTLSQGPSGPLTVSLDLNRIRQAVANLLDNAVKYTPGGGSVSVQVRPEGRWAVVEVEDNGVGIPPEELGQIWERLFRGDRSRSQPGLGLGLGLVRAIVTAHGGKVEVQSRPEAGSRFSMYLPLEIASE